MAAITENAVGTMAYREVASDGAKADPSLTPTFAFCMPQKLSAVSKREKVNILFSLQFETYFSLFCFVFKSLISIAILQTAFFFSIFTVLKKY